jgi:hypothetical protein
MATWLYHQSKPAKVFEDSDVDAALKDGWADTPAAFLDEDDQPDTDNREELIEKCQELGIETGPRWGVKRLQKAIDDHSA